MRAPVVLLVILLLVDGMLVAVHIAAARLGASPFDPAWLVVHRWRVDADQGVAEVAQYLKLALLSIGAVLLYRRGMRGMLAFAALFFVLLLDDWLQGHERLGSFIADALVFGPAAGLPPDDVGELLAWLLLGLIFLGLCWVAGRRTGLAERRTIRTMTVLVVVLALFGVVVDMIASLVQGSSVRVLGGTLLSHAPRVVLDLASSSVRLVPAWFGFSASIGEVLTAESVVRAVTELRTRKVVWTVVEEGGEMLVLTLLTALMAVHVRRQPTIVRIRDGPGWQVTLSPAPRQRRPPR